MKEAEEDLEKARANLVKVSGQCTNTMNTSPFSHDLAHNSMVLFITSFTVSVSEWVLMHLFIRRKEILNIGMFRTISVVKPHTAAHFKFLYPFALVFLHRKTWIICSYFETIYVGMQWLLDCFFPLGLMMCLCACCSYIENSWPFFGLHK